MLTLWGSGGDSRYCDGRTRREFLRLGGLAMGGLSLPDLLHAEAQGASPTRSNAGGTSHKSVIMIYLSGGPAHQDTFDLKPEAPDGIRGEYKPIATRLPGVHICEHLPRIAGLMDKVAVIRSIVGLRDEHSSSQSVTGFPRAQAQRERRPNFGSIVGRIQGMVDPVVPPCVDLSPRMQHMPYNIPGSGFLGAAYRPSRVEREDLALLSPPTDVSAPRFDRRKALLGEFDHFRRYVDNAEVDGMDAIYRRAFDILTSDKVAKALDLSREDPRLRDRYGIGSPVPVDDAGPRCNDQFLIARRLVEAGARCVTIAFGSWDMHGGNFERLRVQLPLFDQGVSSLVEDLHDRGLDRDVTVVAWGEFGRTPKINKDAGRDHWSPVSMALLFGGGMRVGQVIGSTDKLGGSAASRPVHYQDVLATVYHNLGIDPHAFIRDEADRPVSILPATAEPIRELIA
jgi:hypothetical protein